MTELNDAIFLSGTWSIAWFLKDAQHHEAGSVSIFKRRNT